MLKGKKNKDFLVAGIADEHKRMCSSTYLPIAQKGKVLGILGPTTFIVLVHYFDKISLHSFDFDDATVAKELGLPERTIRKARQKLTREGWVFQFIYRNPAVKPTMVTLVGEHTVRRHKSNPETFAQTLSRIFKETQLNESA
jgi:hypothetical protein